MTAGQPEARPDAPPDPAGHVGKEVLRLEDEGFLTGARPYVADLDVPNCLQAVFVRSQMAHAAINGIDVTRAREVPGVVGVYTAADLPDLPPGPYAQFPPVPSGMGRPPLARGRIRFVGEAVAVVVAEDLRSAEDSEELVLQDVEPLHAVIDPVEAAGSGSSQVFEGRSNVVFEQSVGSGDTAEAITAAPVVVDLEVTNGRLAPMSIEPRAFLAVADEGGGLTVWCSHQAPHRLREALAGLFRLDPDRVRVVVPAVGGAFGGKSQTYPEYVVVAHLAMTLGRPVRWLERRGESFVAWTHGRGQRQRLRLAADQDGRFAALDAEITGDLGAYPETGGLIPMLTAWNMSGPYRIPRISVTVRGVVTNATPTSAYRGAGRPEAAFALERAVEEMARRLAMNPMEIRRRNFIPPDAFPYRSPTGALYDSGRYEDALDLALRSAGYDSLKAEQRSRRERDDERLLGIGIATYVERSGGQAGSTEFARVEVCDDGTVEVRSGSSSQGQGHPTSFAQVAATVLGVDLDQVRVVQGDTALVRDGTGTFGSRSLQVGGTSIHVAAGRVLNEAMRRAAEILEVAPDDLRYADARFSVAGSPDRVVDLQHIVRRTGSLAAEEEFSSPQAFPFGAYLATVEIDRATGDTRLRTLVAVDDCGVLVNPLIARGQVMGSAMQGIGQALFEGIVFDEAGQPLTASLLSYGVPTFGEMADVRLEETVTPNPNSPLGAKGIGEAGCIGAPPAVFNAVLDALEGYDASGLDMPITPEKVWRILQRGPAEPLRRGGEPSAR